MTFYGLQKLSLLDFPGKMVCTVFTGGCNLRCPFCHNASLVLRPGENEQYSPQDIFALLEKRRGILDGVAITGGEPLMHPQLIDFMLSVKSVGFTVKLDTNGCYPEALRRVISEKAADYIAMDVKNSPESYAKTTGVADFDMTPVLESISLLRNGHIPYEFRTTVVKELHCEDDFRSMAKLLSGAERLYLQSFKDSGDILAGEFTAPSKDELERYAEIMRDSVKSVELRGV